MISGGNTTVYVLNMDEAIQFYTERGIRMTGESAPPESIREWSSRTKTAIRSTCGKRARLRRERHHGNESLATTAFHIRSADWSTAGTSSERRKRCRTRSFAARLTLSR